METEPAARHRQVAAAFTARADAVTDWDAPAPVEGWVARDVVRHLVEWLPALLGPGAGVVLPAVPPVDDDPAASWRAHAAAVQALLDDPATGTGVLRNPHIGEVPLPEAVDRFYTTDVFLHTWDLARATGQDDRLDPGHCAELLAGMEPLDAMLRDSGQYGPRVDVPAQAPVQDRLIGFLGRDPSWHPPAG
jgi:uncharacterized protein (TIGR03086 family)